MTQLSPEAYQKQSRTTAFWARPDTRDGWSQSSILGYLGLGLFNELMELDEAAWVDDVLSEAGDVMWYIAQIATEANIGLDTLIGDWWSRPATVNMPVWGVMRPAGVICGALKKAIRDDSGEITPARWAAIRDAMGDFLTALAAVLATDGFSLEDAAVNNAEKLASRAERGVIGGSGGSR